jgi:hypothetical protein
MIKGESSQGIKISLPIKIPFSKLKRNDYQSDNLDQYSLNLNNFNPSKMSPPDDWKSRLQLRLKNHNICVDSLSK